METLLSVAFDNLSSYDGPKVKKGLRQVEGLLAQICLSAHAANKNNNTNNKSPTTPPAPFDGSKQQPATPAPSRFPLSDLSGDAAFREFFKLQDGFQWNIATRLIQTLDRLLAKSDDGSMDLLMLTALDSLQGVLLLHPPSRLLFSREQSMNLLLDLLEPVNCPAIQAATLLVLVVALLETPRNTRTFENLDGLLTVSSIFKSRSTARDVKFKTMEFLYFYLMPETPSLPRAGSDGSGAAALLQRSPSKLGRAFKKRDDGGGANGAGGAASEDNTLNQQVKQEMLRRHLPNVDELVKDLQQYAPFGGAVA
ncbi:cell division control protein 14 [Diaporthe amygdali]|uniref:cell division control protein 14 n=1 Tax=Phomopsis amygdali TaxID=1214568 RepID=UPI0022FE4599|nr:cell division control protein 14 [Diaporthe amygdali]KAJ0120010.1 cell division control protein 14 [Diaporthe amygdali]